MWALHPPHSTTQENGFDSMLLIVYLNLNLHPSSQELRTGMPSCSFYDLDKTNGREQGMTQLIHDVPVKEALLYPSTVAIAFGLRFCLIRALLTPAQYCEFEAILEPCLILLRKN